MAQGFRAWFFGYNRTESNLAMKPANPEAGVEPEVISAHVPKVTNDYRDYVPPFDVAKVVERMLTSVPPKYLVGLSEIVLTNTAGLPRRLRRSMTKSRKRRLRTVQASGLYHQAWNNRPAWIEIYVDNTLRTWERGLWLKLGLIRETAMSGVVFHEIGHHIHFAIKPEYREKEDVADVWKVRLQRNYAAKFHPLLRRFFRLATSLSGPLYGRLLRRGFEWEVRKGWMSQAEFEERTKKKATRDNQGR